MGAANMSKAFRVGRVERSVGMVETTNFPIGLRLEEIAAEDDEKSEEKDEASEVSDDGDEETKKKKKKKKWSKRVSLFSRKSELLKKKKIKLSHDHDFQVILKYDSHSKVPLDDSVSKIFQEFNVTGLRKFATGEYKHLGTPAVELVFQINDDGIPVVTKAEAKLEEIIMPKVEEEDKVEGTNETADGSDASDAAEDKNEASADESKEGSETKESADDDDSKKEAEADQSEKKDATADGEAETSKGDNKEEEKEASPKTEDSKSKDEAKKKKAAKPKKKVHRVQLKLVPVVSEAQTLRRLSQKERIVAMKRLKAMDAADEMRQRRDAEKNSLESFVFEQRGRVRENEEELSKVSPDDEREKIMEDLEALEDWLYEDGEDGGSDAELSVYKDKRKAMQSRVDSIFLRLVELEARPKAVEAARAVIASSKEVMLLWPKERPQLSAEDIKEAEEVMTSISEWLDEKEEEQSKKETTETPAFTSKEVSNKMTRLKNLVAHLLMKKRQAPASAEDLLKSEKPGDKKEEEEDSTAEDTESDSSGDEKDDTTEDSDAKEEKSETSGSEEL